MVRAILFAAVFLLLAASASAATFNCAIRTSCIAGETLFLTVNSSETGQAPNNSHAYLANYTPIGAYSICCSTDAFRTLTNSCVTGSTRILGLQDTNNSHVQIGTNTSYPWSACLNVTFGTISCTYPNSACAAGYTNISSIASSEFADNTSNAHIADPGFYYRKVCCQISGQTPPVIDHVNISPSPNATTRQDLECLNGPVTDADGDAVTLHYNWYRNGTSITVLNLPMDYDTASGITHDISGFNNHGTVNGLIFKPTGCLVGGCFNVSVPNTNITIADRPELNMDSREFSIAARIRVSQAINTHGILRKNGSTSAGFSLTLNADRPQFIITNGTDSLSVSPIDAVDLNTPTFVVATRNATGIYLYTSTSFEQAFTAGGGTWNLTNTLPITIGQNESVGAHNMLIDEIIIFNRSLTFAEIETLRRTNNRQFNSTELRRTEWWNCSITPIDSTGLNGSTKYSNRTNITGSPPLNVTLYYPANNNQSVFERFVNFSWTTADERDGDAVTYIFNLTITPGTCSVATTQSNIATTNYTFGELCTDQLYNWTIEACDIDGCTSPSPLSNFTIASVVGVQLTTNLTQLGGFERNQTKATDADNIAPFIVNNTGNVRINITLNATNEPFTSISMPNTNYQFKAGINTTAAFNTTGSQVTYTPFNTVFKELIKQLNYTARPNTNTTARIDVNITAPIDEPPGQKQGNFTVQAVAS
jgi:hypothetical protein